MAENQSEMLSGTTQGIITDLERLLGQRLGKLKHEVVSELGNAATAGVSLGGGVGMAALGTVLGGLAFVHLTQRITGLPLWLCYAGCSAAACASASALVASGVRKAEELEVIPEGTARRLRNAVNI